VRHTFRLICGQRSRHRAIRAGVAFGRPHFAGRIKAGLSHRFTLILSVAAILSGLVCTSGSPAFAQADQAVDGPEYVVLPYSCSFKSGKVHLAPSNAQAYEVVGSRTERPFTACTTTGNRDCFTMMLHNFDVACDGRRVPWHLMVSQLRGSSFGSSKIVNDQLQLVLKDAKVKVASGAQATAGFGNSKRFLLPVGFAPVGEVGARLVFSGAGGADAGPEIVPIGEDGDRRVEAGPPMPVLTRVGSVEAVSDGGGWVTSVAAGSGKADAVRVEETSSVASRADGQAAEPGSGRDWLTLASVLGVVGFMGFGLFQVARRYSLSATSLFATGQSRQFFQTPDMNSAGMASAAEMASADAVGVGRQVARALASNGARFAGRLNRTIRLSANAVRLPWRGGSFGAGVARGARPGQPAGDFSDIEERWSDHPLLAGGARMLVRKMELCVRAIDRLEPHCAVRETLEHELQDVGSRLEVSRLGLREEAGLDEETFARRGSSMMRAAIRDLERIEKIARSAGISQSMTRTSTHAGGWGGEANGGPAGAGFHEPMGGDPAMDAMPRTKAEAYRVLGVNANVSDAALKKVVDALRMSWHPDLAGDDDADRALRETRIRQINLAWDLIKADEARAVA